MSDFFAELSSSMPDVSPDIVEREFGLLERAKEISEKYKTIDPAEMTFQEKVELQMYLLAAEGSPGSI